MSKRSRCQDARVKRDPYAKTSRQLNQEHERASKPYGQFSDGEKAQFTGRCGLDILAAASMAEQLAANENASTPVGIKLPDDYVGDPTLAQGAFEATTKYAPSRDEVHVQCMTCGNRVGVNTQTAAVIGQQMCQKYCKSEPIQF